MAKKQSLFDQLREESSLSVNNKYTPVEESRLDVPVGGMGYGESQYDKPETSSEVILSGDLEERRAQVQSIPDRLANAVPRLISKVGSEVIKTPGYIYALGEAGLTDKSLAESMNNAWLDTLDNLDQKTKDAFAIYTPQSVKDGNLWDNISSASFWTNEGVDGAGYLLSMMAPGAAMKYAGIAGKLAKTGMSASLAQKAELGASTLMNTTLEAAAETKGLADNLNKQFKDKIEKQEINPLTGNPWTKEEADLAVNNAAHGVFKTNMALLLAPNYIMNKNLLGKFIPTKNSFSKIIDPATGLFKEASQLTKKELIKEASKELGIGLISEGFIEEAGQFSIENYYSKLAKGENSEDLMSGLAEEYSNALSSTEGQKSIFLGGLFGSISAIGAVKDFKKEQEHLDGISKIMQDNFKGFNSSIDNIYKKDNNGEIILDENDNPIINKEELIKTVKNISLENLSSKMKDIYAGLDNKEAFDFISNQEFTRFASPYLQQEGGLEVLNKHIDLLSKKLVENKKQQEGVDDTYDEAKHSSELKQKAKELQKHFESVSNFVDNINIDINEGEEKRYNDFISDLKSSTFQEVSKQLFLSDRIDNLERDILQLSIGTAASLPQVKLDIAKKISQSEIYKKDLEESIKNYNDLFDKKSQIQAFKNFNAKEDILKESISKAEQKQQEEEIKPWPISEEQSEDDLDVVNVEDILSEETDNSVQLNIDEEETAVLKDTAEPEKQDLTEVFTAYTGKSSEPLEKLGRITRKELPVLIKEIGKKNINDHVTLTGHSYKDENGEDKKSVTIQLNNKVVGTMHLPETEGLAESMKQIFHAVPTGKTLSNKEVKKLGFTLTLSPGSINFTDNLIVLSEVNKELFKDTYN